MEGSPPLRRLIVIDDSTTIQAVVRAQLAPHAWQVETYSDGESGAQAALAKPPVAVVCDQQMPGISGIQLCRLLRDDPRTATVPIVILTATTTAHGRFWALESGANAYLAKNELESLAAVLRSLDVIVAPLRRVSVPETSQRTIAARLSHLLDASLFEAVLSNKLRAIATNSTTTRQLVAQFGQLLSNVLPLHWFAMMAVDDHECCLVRNAQDTTIESQARMALGLSTNVPVATVGVHSGASSTQGEPVIRTLMYGEKTLGKFCITLADRPWGPQERAIVELAEKELSVSLQMIRLLEQTQKLAMTDVLTGIGNRRWAADALERSVSAANRHQTALSLVLIDIDHFKQVNDKHGHDGGDAAIVHIASTLSRAVRRSDVVGRWGGEEFLLLLPHTPREGARLVCERLRLLISGREVDLPGGGKLSLTVSMGVVTGTGFLTVEGLLKSADTALYTAKSEGRNRVCLAPI